jgi:hypothetical protein
MLERSEGLQIELNITYRIYMVIAQMSLIDHPISQANLGISPFWTPVITAEVKTTILSSVDYV